MKTKYSALLSLVLMAAPMVFAAQHNSENVTLPDAVTVGGTEVPAGTYRVEWDGTGSVTATIVKGKKVLASVPATVVAAKGNYDGAIDTDGKTLQGIQWRKTSLQFSPNASTPAAATTTGN